MYLASLLLDFPSIFLPSIVGVHADSDFTCSPSDLTLLIMHELLLPWVHLSLVWAHRAYDFDFRYKQYSFSLFLDVLSLSSIFPHGEVQQYLPYLFSLVCHAWRKGMILYYNYSYVCYHNIDVWLDVFPTP